MLCSEFHNSRGWARESDCFLISERTRKMRTMEFYGVRRVGFRILDSLLGDFRKKREKISNVQRGEKWVKERGGESRKARRAGLVDFSNLLVKGHGEVVSGQGEYGWKTRRAKKWRNDVVELARIMCRGIQLSRVEEGFQLPSLWMTRECGITGDQCQDVTSSTFSQLLLKSLCKTSDSLRAGGVHQQNTNRGNIFWKI